MFCPNCGGQMPNEARFCGECGNSIEPATAGPAPSVEAAPHVVNLSAAPAANAVSDALKWGVVAGSLIIPLIGIIMGLIYLVNGDTEEKKSAGRLWLISGVVLGFLWVIVGGGY